MTSRRDPLVRALFGLFAIVFLALLLHGLDEFSNGAPEGASWPGSTPPSAALPTTSARPSPGNRISDERLQHALERRLLRLSLGPNLGLHQSWSQVRGLGRRAPPSARRNLNALVDALEASVPASIPRWVGSEPRVALFATLLESGVAEKPLPLGTLDEVLQRTAPDTTSLAWRLELLGLMRRARPNDEAIRRRSAQLLEVGLKRVERADSATADTARLAGAVFRAAPTVLDFSLTAKLRRTYGRLVRQQRDHPETATALAEKLEAAAVYALLSKALDGEVRAEIRTTLATLRSRLSERAGFRHGDAETPETAHELAAAVRALRLSSAVLEQ